MQSDPRVDECGRQLYRRSKVVIVFFVTVMTYILGNLVYQTVSLVKQQETLHDYDVGQIRAKKPKMTSLDHDIMELTSFFERRSHRQGRFTNEIKGFGKNDTEDFYSPEQEKTVHHVGGKCVPAASWQTMSFPTCNPIHEIDFISTLSLDKVQLKILSQGHHRTVWKLGNPSDGREEPVVIKTLRPYREFNEKNYEMHRLDAVIMEQLSSSPYIVDEFAYCGQSVVTELGLGNLVKANQIFGEEYTWRKKLELAHDVAFGIADMHSMTGQKSATFVHRDLDAANIIVSKDGHLKLNDFNSAQMLFWDDNAERMCKYRDLVSCSDKRRKADTRTPEECLGQNLTEKVDVFAIAPIISRLLTGVRMYHSDKGQAEIASDNKRISKAIVSGDIAPKLPMEIEQSEDPAVVGLKNAMKQALTYDADARPSAMKIAQYLNRTIRNMNEKNG